jgi:hypothetical protein
VLLLVARFLDAPHNFRRTALAHSPGRSVAPVIRVRETEYHSEHRISDWT